MLLGCLGLIGTNEAPKFGVPILRLSFHQLVQPGSAENPNYRRIRWATPDYFSPFDASGPLTLSSR